MADRKVYVKKPFRRYEKDLEQKPPPVENEEAPEAGEDEPVIHPDITSGKIGQGNVTSALKRGYGRDRTSERNVEDGKD